MVTDMTLHTTDDATVSTRTPGPAPRSIGMMDGMTEPKRKIAISLRSDLLKQVRDVVAAGHSPSVSAYIEHAIVTQLTIEADWDAMQAEVFAGTGGPPTEDERAEARRFLGISDR